MIFLIIGFVFILTYLVFSINAQLDLVIVLYALGIDVVVFSHMNYDLLSFFEKWFSRIYVIDSFDIDGVQIDRKYFFIAIPLVDFMDLYFNWSCAVFVSCIVNPRYRVAYTESLSSYREYHCVFYIFYIRSCE